MKSMFIVILIFGSFTVGFCLNCWVGNSFNGTLAGGSIPCDGTCVHINGSYIGQQIDLFACEPNDTCTAGNFPVYGFDAYCCQSSDNCNAAGFNVPPSPSPPPTLPPINCYAGIYVNSTNITTVATMTCYGRCASTNLLFNSSTSITVATCNPINLCDSLGLENSCNSTQQSLSGCCCNSSLCINPANDVFPTPPGYCYGLTIPFYAYSAYCNVTGNINLNYVYPNNVFKAIVSVVDQYNFSQPLCVSISNFQKAASGDLCQTFYVPNDNGYINIDVTVCGHNDTLFSQSIGPIYYTIYDGFLSNAFGTCADESSICDLPPATPSTASTVASTLDHKTFSRNIGLKGSFISSFADQFKMKKYLPPTGFSYIDSYCGSYSTTPGSSTTTNATSPLLYSLTSPIYSTTTNVTASQIFSPTTTTFVSNYSTTISTPTTSSIFIPPNPNAITPPPPLFNCTDENSYIIDQTCAINGTTNSTHISQIINETTTTIHELIKNDSFTSDDVHDTGIFIYHTVTTVDSLTTDSAHKFLDITSTVSVQPLNKLADANNITPNSLLWYPSSIPKVVAKTYEDLNYTKDGANLLLNSFTLDSSFCGNPSKSHEICYSKNSQVSSGSDDAEFCTTFNPTSLCNNSSKKAYLTMWKSLSFFALVKNNSLGIKTGLDSTETTTPDQPVTFDTADKCSDGTYLKNNYGSNVGGVDDNGQSASTSSSVWIKRRDDENDLHISKYRIAKFTATSFEDAGTTVTKNTKHYTAECPDGTCILIADGNPTEPTICNTTTKTTQNIVIGIGIALAAIAVISLIFQSDYFAVVSRVLQIFFSVFNDKNLPKRVKFFAYCYNITFMLYSIYLIFIAQQEDSSDKMCTAFAIVGYILYISAIFLSIIMLIITLEVLGCWKPAIRNSLYIFTGNQMIVLPFIHSYGIPLLITGGFAWAFTSFFKRNDGYCWIRPDYAFPALWIPLILLLLTIPLYIILIARRWANVGFFKMIYGPFTVPEEIALFEELRRKKEDQEKEEDIEDFKKKILGKSYQPNGNSKAEEEKAKDEKIILTSRTIARLMIPQMFLAIPLIAENMALYYAHVTGWHYLFLLTQGLQAIVLNGMDWLEDLPDKFEDFKDRLSALRGSPKEVVPEETRWGTDNPIPKNGNAANSTRM